MKEYIYLRYTIFTYIYNVYKLGRTNLLYERNSQYKTGEFIGGKFIMVFKVHNSNYVEKLLQLNLKKYNVKTQNGGSEFYNTIIENKIESILIDNNIQYELLNSNQIKDIMYKEKNIIYKQKYKNINTILKKKLSLIHLIQKLLILKFKPNILKLYIKPYITPKIYQAEILENTIDLYYTNNNIGKLLWSCGLGKTFMSLFISYRLKAKKILIGVPSIYLQEQFINCINTFYNYNKNIQIIINNKNNYKFIIDQLLYFNKGILFIITTYHSCKFLKNLQMHFDFKIGDEAHHLTGYSKNFIRFHDIKSHKTLFMTATNKISLNNLISMDNTDYFGNIIDTKSIKWAIDNKYITDYNILILYNSYSEYTYFIEKYKVKETELFITAFMLLKAINTYTTLTHIIIYTNSIKSANIINSYINIINTYFNIKNLFNVSLNSNLSNHEKNANIKLFIQSKIAIISSVYIFGEGFDLPKLNGVCFAENMNSNIRIIQSALRPNRLEKNNFTKIAYIIIPYIDMFLLKADKHFYNIKKVIQKLSKNDMNIMDKITVLKNNSYFEKTKSINLYNQLEIDYEELETLKIKLKFNDDKLLNDNEFKYEYLYIKSILKKYNINTYEELHFIENSINIHNLISYFISKNVYTNFYDFISKDTTTFIQTKEEWIQYCIKFNIKSVADYNNLALYNLNLLPLYPDQFYIGFTNLLYELKIITRR
jgi:predicted helicase